MSGFRHSVTFNTPPSNNTVDMMNIHADSQHQTPSASGAFLPNFLLGSTVSPSSQSYKRTMSSFQGASPPSSSFHSFLSPQFPSAEKSQSRKRVSPPLHSNLRDKSSTAPPVEGLYENGRTSIDEIRSNSSWELTPSKLQKSNTGQSFSVTPVHQDTSLNTSLFSSRQDVFAQSPAQIDPFYTQGESLTSSDILDETWVTIFGFPPSLVAYILEQFSQYGTIEKKEISSNANWLHIKYHTKLQAKKALSKNGKILNGNIMIGVRQCIDKKVMTANQQDTTTYKSLINTPSSNVIQSPNAKPTAIRPLTAAYQAAANQNKVIQEGKGTPQRNNSIVSKTLEYVFGW